MADVQMTATENGPYKVAGAVELVECRRERDRHEGPDGVPVPVRRLDQQAVLRRHAFEDRFPRCDRRGRPRRGGWLNRPRTMQ